MSESSSKKTGISYLVYLVVTIGVVFLLITLFMRSNKNNDLTSLTPLEDMFSMIKPIGLEVTDSGILYENHDSNLISIDIRFKGGAALDPVGYEGLTYMLVEAMGKAAGGYSVSEFSQLLEENSIVLNLDTNRDHISIRMTVLSHYRAIAFRILKMILISPNFGVEDINLVKNETLSYYKLISSRPEYEIGKQLINEIFKGHPYFREIAGNSNVVAKITPKILRDFKDKVITKDNLYVAVSGSISLDELKRELDIVFTDLPRGNVDFLSLSYVAPKIPKISNKVIEVPFAGASQSDILIVFSAPSAGAERYMEAALLDIYLGGMPESLLFDVLRNENGLVYGIVSNLYSDSVTDYWMIKLATSLDKSDIAIDKVMEVLKNIKNKQYKFSDIMIAKNWELDNELRNFVNNDSISSYLNSFQINGNYKDIIRNREALNEINEKTMNDFTNSLDITNVAVIKIVSKK